MSQPDARGPESGAGLHDRPVTNSGDHDRVPVRGEVYYREGVRIKVIRVSRKHRRADLVMTDPVIGDVWIERQSWPFPDDFGEPT